MLFSPTDVHELGAWWLQRVLVVVRALCASVAEHWNSVGYGAAQ